MTIYVDPLIDLKRWKYGESCHLATDGDIDELHAFAQGIGLKRGWFQPKNAMPHYDLNRGMREKAVAAGAVEVNTRELIIRCRNRSLSLFRGGIPPDGT